MKTPTLVRLSKEARTLFPLWAVTLVAMIAPYFFLSHGSNREGWILSAYCLGSALLGAASFGHEFTHRTMGLLLSQPVPRTRIWLEKMTVLGAMLFGTMLLFLVLAVRIDPPTSDDPRDFLFFGLLILLPAMISFCTGPTLTLMFRSLIVGAAVTAIGPISVILVGVAIVSVWCRADEVKNWILNYNLIMQPLYCVCLLPLGCRLFQRLQDSGTTSQEVALPAKLAAPFKSLPTILTLGQRGPIASLVRKELRLQQPTYLVTVVIVVVWLGLLVAKIFRPSISMEALISTPFMLGMIGIPVVAGIISVAEERNLGVHDWHLTLPVSARKQWLIKTIITLLTSMLFGSVLPFLLGLIAKRMFDSSDAERLREFKAFPLINLTFTAVSIYASTFSANTLRALVATITLLIVGGIVLTLTAHFHPAYFSLKIITAIYFTLLYVAFEMGLSNFRRVLGSIWKPVRQVALMSAILVVLLSVFNVALRIAADSTHHQSQFMAKLSFVLSK